MCLSIVELSHTEDSSVILCFYRKRALIDAHLDNDLDTNLPVAISNDPPVSLLLVLLSKVQSSWNIRT